MYIVDFRFICLFKQGNKTFLARACENQDVELVRILLSSGADVNASVSASSLSKHLIVVIERHPASYYNCG